MATAIVIYILMAAVFWWLAYDSCRRRKVDPRAPERIIARWLFTIFWPLMTILVFAIMILRVLGIIK